MGFWPLISFKGHSKIIIFNVDKTTNNLCFEKTGLKTVGKLVKMA